MNMQRPPEVTVAALAEHHGKFLMIEERVNGALVLNQPGGHLENNETLAEAAARECCEESGWQFRATDLCGIYRWQHPRRHVAVMCFAFRGEAYGHDPLARLDVGVVRALWLTPQEIYQQRARLRSPAVEQGIRDYLDGRSFPMDLISEVDSYHELANARRAGG